MLIISSEQKAILDGITQNGAALVENQINALTAQAEKEGKSVKWPQIVSFQQRITKYSVKEVHVALWLHQEGEDLRVEARVVTKKEGWKLMNNQR